MSKVASKRRPRYDPYAPAQPAAIQHAATRRKQLLWLAGGTAVGLAGAGGAVLLGARSQSQAAAVEVNLDLDAVTVDRPLVELGVVPLNKVVPVVVALVNQSQRVVGLGKPIAEALEGC